MLVTAAHDLEHPCAGPGDGSLHLPPLVACIGDDPLQKGEAPARLPQEGVGPVPVLNIGWVDADGQQQAERVGQDVALAAQDLLARVIAGRVERGPPFRAPFTLWLSMIAVVGLASRPAFSRTSTYSTWWMRLSVPSQSHRSKYSQPCCAAGSPSGVPSTDTPSRARRRSRSGPLARRPFEDARRVWRAGSAAQPAPTRLP